MTVLQRAGREGQASKGLLYVYGCPGSPAWDRARVSPSAPCPQGADSPAPPELGAGSGDGAQLLLPRVLGLQDIAKGSMGQHGDPPDPSAGRFSSWPWQNSNPASNGMGSLLRGWLVGGDQQQSWKDGDVLGEKVEGRGEEEEEALMGDIPFWAQGSCAALSLLSPYHPTFNTALLAVRQRNPLCSQRGNLSILPT